MFHANVPGRVLGRMAGVPVVISSERTMGQEGRARRTLNRATAPLADRIICVSARVRDYAEQVIGLPPARLVVVPNGIDLARYTLKTPQAAGTGSQPVQIGYVGRLDPVKGVTHLLGAAALLRESAPSLAWALTLVGDGSERAALEAEAAALELAERVRFLGARSDVPALLPTFDLLVLPSLYEGMPNVALEAMASGLPVVATAVGGTPEVVLHGETGLLVPPAEAAALAGALAALAVDPARRARLGAAGRARVERHFTIDAAVRRTEALYRDLLARKGIAVLPPLSPA
jgi:starch synthase (maltosyl-transferring)